MTTSLHWPQLPHYLATSETNKPVLWLCLLANTQEPTCTACRCLPTYLEQEAGSPGAEEPQDARCFYTAGNEEAPHEDHPAP